MSEPQRSPRFDPEDDNRQLNNWLQGPGRPILAGLVVIGAIWAIAVMVMAA